MYKERNIMEIVRLDLSCALMGIVLLFAVKKLKITCMCVQVTNI